MISILKTRVNNGDFTVYMFLFFNIFEIEICTKDSYFYLLSSSMVAIEKLRGHLIGELFSQVSVGGLKPVAAKIYYLLLF